MKKLLKLAGIIAFVAVIGFAFFACDEDEEGDSLSGTTWKTVSEGVTLTITFNSPNFSMTSSYEGQTVPYLSGTYSVSGSTVTITYTMEGETYQGQGTISGNTLTFGGMIFTKQ